MVCAFARAVCCAEKGGRKGARLYTLFVVSRLFTFLVDKQLMDGTLKVQVYDKDTHIDEFLGECEVNLLEHVDIKVACVRNARNKVGCRVLLSCLYALLHNLPLRISTQERVSFECMCKGKSAGKIFLSFSHTTIEAAPAGPTKMVPENLEHRLQELESLGRSNAAVLARIEGLIVNGNIQNQQPKATAEGINTAAAYNVSAPIHAPEGSPGPLHTVHAASLGHSEILKPLYCALANLDCCPNSLKKPALETKQLSQLWEQVAALQDSLMKSTSLITTLEDQTRSLKQALKKANAENKLLADLAQHRIGEELPTDPTECNNDQWLNEHFKTRRHQEPDGSAYKSSTSLSDMSIGGHSPRSPRKVNSNKFSDHYEGTSNVQSRGEKREGGTRHRNSLQASITPLHVSNRSLKEPQIDPVENGTSRPGNPRSQTYMSNRAPSLTLHGLQDPQVDAARIELQLSTLQEQPFAMENTLDMVLGSPRSPRATKPSIAKADTPETVSFI